MKEAVYLVGKKAERVKAIVSMPDYLSPVPMTHG